MSFWFLLQILINVVLFAAVGFMWVRLQKPAKDDPRLSRGLQLLQSKISVLEDLSDRTETQARQLTTLIEQKCREVQGVVLQTEKQLQKIEQSMEKSREVAKIFQDKIPHQEIIERQNSLKYIKAARLAHQGLSVEEISKQVDLARGELEFIANVNRQQLQFSESDLPDWAQETTTAENTVTAKPESAGDSRPEAMLSNLGSKFRQALNGNDFSSDSASSNSEGSAANQSVVQSASQAGAKKFENIQNAQEVIEGSNSFENSEVIESLSTQPVAAKSVTAAPIENRILNRPNDRNSIVKKVVFPRIDARNNLS